MNETSDAHAHRVRHEPGQPRKKGGSLGRQSQEETKGSRANLPRKRRPYRLVSEVELIHDPERERAGLLATLDLGGDDGESSTLRPCE